MSLDNVRIVLVSPMYGGNVGSVCRAMANTELSDLAIACPNPLDMDEARMMACHSTHILDGRSEHPGAAEAVSDCAMVVGTSVRGGLYRMHAKSPREWAPLIIETAKQAKVALVFGPENNGLAKEDLALCTHIIQIPASASFSSLNLAQAVMICCYEIFLAEGAYEPPKEKSPEAPSDLRERMFSMWQETLLEIGFMQSDKAEHMMFGLRRILSRGKLSVNDARIMMGIARQALWARHHATPKVPAPQPTDEESLVDNPCRPQ